MRGVWEFKAKAKVFFFSEHARLKSILITRAMNKKTRGKVILQKHSFVGRQTETAEHCDMKPHLPKY